MHGVKFLYNVSDKHWEYYASIEDDFLKSTRYVAMSEDNIDCHSIEFCSMFLRSCIEMETIGSSICNMLCKDSHKRTFRTFKKLIFNKNKWLYDFEIVVSTWDVISRPWLEWKYKDSEKPTIWSDFESVKHNRHRNFKLCTLKNAFVSLMALFSFCILYEIVKYPKIEGNRLTVLSPAIRPKLITSYSFPAPSA